MPFGVRWLLARLMDGEIDQNYLHATGGTGFYFVLPLAGEKGERTYGVHSTCGYGAATMYTEVSKLPEFIRSSEPLHASHYARATHRHAKRVCHGRNKAADPTSRKTSSPSLTRVGASMILGSGSGSSPSHLNHFRFQASKH
ncbi:predicted protein [Botrytis cinerea T4]|uniref:Uncharacterized protein n=1 Tax=Botryotinia fuckeliana (strain T4) TaxID=999810 RepID=G2YJ47_BOTF4|nr:predicted protein [Botrytis cinerea T4]